MNWKRFCVCVSAGCHYGNPRRSSRDGNMWRAELVLSCRPDGNPGVELVECVWWCGRRWIMASFRKKSDAFKKPVHWIDHWIRYMWNDTNLFINSNALFLQIILFLNCVLVYRTHSVKVYNDLEYNVINGEHDGRFGRPPFLGGFIEGIHWGASLMRFIEAIHWEASEWPILFCI